MNQEIIRRDLKEYLKNNGIKNRFIAIQIGISDSMVSYFLTGKRKLSSGYLKQISDIIYS